MYKQKVKELHGEQSV